MINIGVIKIKKYKERKRKKLNRKKNSYLNGFWVYCGKLTTDYFLIRETHEKQISFPFFQVINHTECLILSTVWLVTETQ